MEDGDGVARIVPARMAFPISCGTLQLTVLCKAFLEADTNVYMLQPYYLNQRRQGKVDHSSIDIRVSKYTKEQIIVHHLK